MLLQSRSREVILVPQELVVLNDTAGNVQEGLALQLPCDGVYPGPGVCQLLKPFDRHCITHFVMFS